MAYSKRDRDNKTNRHLPENFATRSWSRCLSPCPDCAHEDLLPVTMTNVPSPSRFAGSPCPSQPPPEKGSAENFKPSPCCLRGVSSSECDVRKERSRKLAPPLVFGGRCQRLINRHCPRPYWKRRIDRSIQYTRGIMCRTWSWPIFAFEDVSAFTF